MASTQTDRLNGVRSSAAIKLPCDVATTADITQSALQTIDGVSVTAGMRVLCKDQTDQTTNGVYIAATGDWERAADFQNALDVVRGTLVWVNQGTVNAQTAWQLTTSTFPIDFGTTNLTFSAGSVSGPSSSTDGNIVTFNGGTGTKIKDGGVALSDVVTLDGQGQAVSGGAHVTAYDIGTVSSGTTTIDPGKCSLQYLTNNGAFTLAAPSYDGSCTILATNGASAGSVTFSGFTVGSNTGDSLDTTSGHKFMIVVVRIDGVSTYTVVALQ